MRVEPETARTLAARIAAMRADPEVRKALARSRTLPLGMRRAIIDARLSKLATADATLARLFVVGEVLDAAEIARALDASTTAALRKASLLVDEPGGMRATIALPLDGEATFLVARHGDDGPRLSREDATSVPWPDVTSEARHSSAVHLGAGAGALRLARSAERTWALDARAGARTLMEWSAALAGTELRFEDPPSTIDRLAIDLLDDGAATMHDAVTLLRRLAGDSVATIVLESADVAARAQIEANLPEAARVLWLDRPPLPIDEACALAAAERHPELGPRYEEAYVALRGAAEGDAIQRAVIVVVRSAGATRGWTVRRTIRETRFSELPIATIFASIDRIRAPIDEVLASTVRIPEGTRIRDGSLHVPLAVEPIPVAATALEALLQLHGAPDVGAAIHVVADRSAMPAAKVATHLVPFVRDALRDGLLEVSR